MLLSVIYVGAGGALGAVSRFLIQVISQAQGWAPWGTFLVNVLGCFLIGILVSQLDAMHWFKEFGRHLLVIGFLGAFTTFSAFSIETIQLVQSGRLSTALVYVTVTVVACLLATWVGIKVVPHA